MNLIASAKVPSSHKSNPQMVEIWKVRDGYEVGVSLNYYGEKVFDRALVVQCETTARTIANMLFYSNGNVSAVRNEMSQYV